MPRLDLTECTEVILPVGFVYGKKRAFGRIFKDRRPVELFPQSQGRRVFAHDDPPPGDVVGPHGQLQASTCAGISPALPQICFRQLISPIGKTEVSDLAVSDMGIRLPPPRPV